MKSSGARRTVSVVGAGVVGSALARRLCESGYSIDVVSSRRADSSAAAVDFVGAGRAGDVAAAAGADIVLVTTPDRAIGAIAEALASSPGLRPSTSVIHVSGALSSDVLAPVRRRGAKTASMHPLQSFARREEAVAQIAGSYFFCEGEAIDVALTLAADVGGIGVSIRTEGKVLYHAGAAVLSNGIVTLAASAVDLLEKAGVSRAQALAALVPLGRGTLENLATIGLPQALTGPIARGDVDIVSAHVDALRREAPDLLRFYEVLATRQIDLGVAKGTLSAEAGATLRRLLASGCAT
ncbi:MAG: DUF2520 domain-containing protein [Planctomycetes bacterium]|nr:DUF2520 domain-containing protein [Planctomycetota bacterium]MBI3844109.1 DUF2520 domain-containing protein [Planctomycetota bacterium]